jgi:hypothetical protein
MARVCRLRLTRRQAEHRGVAWIAGAFVICPCHLPITVAVATTVFSGSAVGALIAGYPSITGAVVTVAWAAATWHGLSHLRRASRSTS